MLMVFRQRQQGMHPRFMDQHAFHRGGFSRAPQQPTGNSTIQQMIQRFINPSQAGGALSQGNMSGISNTLNNVQQVLRVIQTAAPIVQEYGPMVKNLPAMYKMLKAMQEVNEEDPAETEEGETSGLDDEKDPNQKTQKSDIDNDSSTNGQHNEEDVRQSTPKLYI